MNEPAAQVDSPVATPVLRTFGLRRAFGSFEAVRGVSLELAPGQIYGFLGRNGAGKTTTLRMLIGVLRPDAGEIELLGQRGKWVHPHQRRRIGYLSQEQVFYPWMTARELGTFVAGFYPTWDDAEFLRLLKNLDVPLERKARFLSGGTRAKLGLALALAHRPAVLILDEPTAGLDPVARREFLDILASQIRGSQQAAIFSSHLVSEVQQVCDRIGILQDGQLRHQGSLTSLLRSHRRLTFPPAPPPAEPEVTAAPQVSEPAAPEPEPPAPAEEPIAAPPELTPSLATGIVPPMVATSAATAPPASAQSADAHSTFVPQVAVSTATPAAGVARVRRAAPAFDADNLPPGLEPIRRELLPDGTVSLIVRAEEETWAREAGNVTGEPMTLEEIFLAYARETGRA